MCDLYGCGDTPSDLPLPVVSAMERRDFLKGVTMLPLATVLAYPELAHAAAMRTLPISVRTPTGNIASGVVAMPEAEKAPAVLLIHEWWGLNDQIKAVAAEYAAQGYIALAVDLYDGKVADTREGAMALMQGMDARVATEKLTTLIEWLRAHENGTGKVGTVGWCFGGGWSLNCSMAVPVDATVVYYGNVAKKSENLKALSGPVLGHFGRKDANINAEMVGGFETAMQAAGKTDLTVYWYDADHAFANPTGARYDGPSAKLSWERTLAFFEQKLK
ncbi:MAG: dienelactone hydrolase family protein [Rhodospirillales bacterium]|nr:dienelactone hydrolase family protein [Rhodospirillales bacterium]